MAEPADNKKPLVKPLGNVIGFTGGFESDLSRLRDALDVEDAIILQPPAWGKGTCALSVATKPPWRLRVALERSAFYVSPAGAPGVVLERLYPDCPSVDMSMFEPGVLLCPVYGLHHGSVRADLALPCIVRALAALCDRLGRHGVVLALGAEALHALPLPPAADAMHGYARRDVKRWLGDKQNKGRVLVAYSGVLPPDVFQTVVAHCNLPYFFEGAGTLSTAFNLGKPYIRLLGNDRDKNYYPELAGHERDVSRLDTLGTDVARQGDRHTTFEALSAYFMYCTVRPRDASAYFAALRKKYHRAAMDKVFLAVAAWVLGARKTGEALANLALDDWSGK